MARLITIENKLNVDTRLVFIHVPRTGGTFVREVTSALGIKNHEIGKCADNAYDYKHHTYGDVIREHPNLEIEAISFGLVRKPFDWYESIWKYSKHHTHYSEKVRCVTAARNHWMGKVWDDDFVKFVENIIAVYPHGIATQVFTKFLFGVEEIGRFEENVAFLAKMLCVSEAKIKQLPVMHNESLPDRIPVPEPLIKKVEEIEKDIYGRYYR